jgi:hypothetical protein
MIKNILQNGRKEILLILWQQRYCTPSVVKINLGLDLMNYFNKKIKELKEDDHPANNAHIYAINSHIEVIKNSLKDKCK